MKTLYVLSPKARVIRFAVLLLCLLVAFGCYKKKSDDYNDNNNNNPPPGSGSFSGDFVKSSNSVVTQAYGSVTSTLDSVTRVLSYSVSWYGLSSNPNGMHFHDDGPIIANITGFPTDLNGGISGSVTLTQDQVNDLKNGKIYVQIHTVNYIPGEILAHLARH